MLSRRAILSLPLVLATASHAHAAKHFIDPLFKLFVIAEMLRQKRLDLGSYDAFHEKLLGRPHDTTRDGFRANPKAWDYFAQLQLSDDDLAAADELDLDGGNPIFRYVDPNWQGYTDGIDVVTRFDDLALLPNLNRFHNTAFVKESVRLSLAPFRGLSRLKRIDATFGDYSDVEALLDLPALSACRLLGNRVYTDVMTSGHPTRQAMEALKAKGVRVLVHWVSLSGPPFR